ncbi:transcription factor IIIB 60 kDa subunit-like isoform X2 [Euphorbia lathyris]|uniref:transcription factor IIIB 60 kDa subunit-like isoform X2 n=1 Tax=Euphorbia lathyris TaxID=212925 RepID=UPI003313693A
MVFCKACARDVPGIRDGDGLLSCGRCGKVLKFDNYSTEATFVKNSSGQSQLSGKLVRSVGSEDFSRQRLYEKAYEDLVNIKSGLGMGENLAMVDQAMVYYRIAVEKNFTRGRRTELVQATCLYIACRENRKPYLLIDFSNYLRINIYVLGAVFLQLCKVLNLTEHPICQKLLDPSIFIHKYTASLSGGKNKDISDAALTIIASMNRDWMQTGRRPSGLWGAALYISALSHGLNCSKSDILKMVHVCEATLSKRLVEFENTESGSLTIEELNLKAEELKESSTDRADYVSKAPNSRELLCQHKGTSRIPHAYGLCKDCYAYFIGFEGGSDPPAFQRAEKQRKESSSLEDPSLSLSLDECRDKRTQYTEPDSLGEAPQQLPTDDGGYAKLHGDDNMGSKDLDESDNFSDIDDAEVDGYLHNEEEAQYKKIIWEEMNREYLEEQAAKEAFEAAKLAAWEADFKGRPEDMQNAKELKAALAKAFAKEKKEKQQKRAAEAKNAVPPQSASEAARQMLTKKGLNDPKKQRTESHSDNDDSTHTNNKNDDTEPANENENGNEDDAEAYDYKNDTYDENVEEGYGYDYDGDKAYEDYDPY